MFNVNARLQTLREYLDPEGSSFQHPGQHKNIMKLNTTYESGERKDDACEIWLLDGQEVSKEKAIAKPGYV